jgi:prepilin-type N-terminal cleavage/methylation domain-containing protein
MNRLALRRKREAAAGFTLLEVLVAATLMGLVLVIILQVLTTALRAQEASRSNTQAVLTAQKVLEEFSDKELAQGSFQGKEGSFAYEVSLTPQFQVPFPGQNKQLVCSLLKVTISWEERGKVKHLDLQTLRTTLQKRS